MRLRPGPDLLHPLHRPRLLLCALALLAALPARAQVPDLRQLYEERLIEAALAQTGLSREEEPAGKRLERVEIVRDEVIAPGDAWPVLLNRLHVTSQEVVVRQELLLEPGERWDQERVDETARNLRKLSILSVVRTVACRGSAPDQVVLLIVTTDLWSLRLNSALTVVGATVQVLDTQPTEANLLGSGNAVGLHARVQQLDLASLELRDKAALGETLAIPRLFGTRLALAESFDLLLSGALPCGGRTSAGGQWCTARAPGKLEGFAGTVDLQRPLFSLATEWAFDLAASANVRQVRRFAVNADGGLGLDTTTFDGSAVPADQRVYLPQVYDAALWATQATVTRSFGVEQKHDLSLGLGATRTRYSVPDGFAADFGAVAVQQYASRLLPRSEATNYLLAGYRAHDTRYVRLHDIQGFALTEDYLLGLDVSLVARAASALGLLRQSFGDLALKAQLRFYFEDDLLTLLVAAQTRWQPNLDELGRDGPWANNAVELSIRNASPRALGGRFHAYAHLLLRNNDLTQAQAALGSDTGLRGFPANAFAGQDLVQVNLEYRSEPINLFSLHLGLVGFYDGGAVFGGPDPRSPTQQLAFAWHQGVGVGLRAQFPQFDKSPIRADFGVPLGGGAGLGTWFSFSLGQAF